MHRSHFSWAGLCLLMPILCSANSFVVPTTTLAAQTSNNTSANSRFPSQSNGNRGAGSVSKVNLHTLLYPGATTKVYAHLMLWFGGSNHMDVGYSSTDQEQIKKQIDDMVSRGIDGVVIDWYGPDNSIDQATRLVMAEAGKHPGFSFAVMVDQGAMRSAACSGCSAQQTLINLLQYVEHNYFASPAYMTAQGRPVVTNFDIAYLYTIDWDAVDAALSTHPLFLFQNNAGFSRAASDGSYAWIQPTTNDAGMDYLSSFYESGMSFRGEQTVGAAYKGFNDTMASWGSGRVMEQQCGQTWLQTFSQINSFYHEGMQLPGLQLVTWNDYEEATELESGIDNCLSLSTSVAGNSLGWTVKGKENTVDHYRVYISSDGQNLMNLSDLAPEVHTLDLCNFPVPAGNYQLFVQAIGKPSLTNQMSGITSYSPSCASGDGISNVGLSASPSSLTIMPGASGSFAVTANMQSGPLSSPIWLSCSGLPSGMNCSFSPASITPGSGTATSIVTVSAASMRAGNPRSQKRSAPIYASWLLPLGLVGFTFACTKPGRGRAQLLSILLLVGIGTVTVSCGGNSGAMQAGSGPNSYSVTVIGNSSSSQLSTTVNITVQ